METAHRTATLAPCRCCGKEAICYSYLTSTEDWVHAVKCRYNDCQTVDHRAESPQAAAALWNAAQNQVERRSPISELVLLILDTVMRVNAQGQWHGFVNYSGHTTGVSVYFRPADHDWQMPADQFPPADIRHAYLSSDQHEDEDATQRAVHDLLTFALGFLATSQESAA